MCNLPRSFVVCADDGGSSVISCKLYSFRTSWMAANSFSPKFWSLLVECKQTHYKKNVKINDQMKFLCHFFGLNEIKDTKFENGMNMWYAFWRSLFTDPQLSHANTLLPPFLHTISHHSSLITMYLETIHLHNRCRFIFCCCLFFGCEEK